MRKLASGAGLLVLFTLIHLSFLHIWIVAEPFGNRLTEAAEADVPDGIAMNSWLNLGFEFVALICMVNAFTKILTAALGYRVRVLQLTFLFGLPVANLTLFPIIGFFAPIGSSAFFAFGLLITRGKGIWQSANQSEPQKSTFAWSQKLSHWSRASICLVLAIVSCLVFGFLWRASALVSDAIFSSSQASSVIVINEFTWLSQELMFLALCVLIWLFALLAPWRFAGLFGRREKLLGFAVPLVSISLTPMLGWPMFVCPLLLITVGITLRIENQKD